MYRVKNYTGGYRERQEAANQDGAVCFVALHFNSSPATANYSLVILPKYASRTARFWAQTLVKSVVGLFGTVAWGPENDGVKIGGFDGRGDSQINLVQCPAILPELLFCSNPEHAAILRAVAGRQALAEALVDSIRTHFPKGGLVAFSVGHAGKPEPHAADRGAVIVPIAGDASVYYEADAAEDVLNRAAALLSSF